MTLSRSLLIPSQCPPNLLRTLAIKKHSPIRAMGFNSRINYLITSDFITGSLGIFDIGKPGKENFSKEVASYQTQPGARALDWLRGRSEFAVGLADGNVSFWTAKKGRAICTPATTCFPPSNVS